MPLIDGKYEIISERILTPSQTLFEATAPDGAAVRIVWFELAADQEERFERYRRTVKRLKRAERAAVYDVVSRPGAHYVAWWPPNDARPVPADPELEEALSVAGYDPGEADVRRNERGTLLYGLAFEGTRPEEDHQEEASQTLSESRQIEPPVWSMTVVVTVLLILASLGFLRAGVVARSNDRLVILPNLVGSEINEAASRLTSMGLAVEGLPVASQEPAGTILKSEPPGASQLRPGRTVRLSYALPAGSVTPTEVPRVIARMYPDEAEQVLAAAGLTLGTVSRIPADQAADLVISQNPAPGSAAGLGSEVDLLVSGGPGEPMTFLPNLVGSTLEEARYLARLAGLRPERIFEDEVPAAGAAAGTVVAQSLRPNQPIPRDDAVLRLIVARSEREIPSDSGLPSFVGMTPDEARELAGRLPVAVEPMSDRALPEGVVDQVPPAGMQGAESVTLVVNMHPVPIPRPDVQARVREPEPRELPFRWFIEPGIPVQIARVYATTLEGESTLVLVREVRGGDRVEGTWRTSEPGPVRFNLTLNDQPYGGEQLAN